MEWNAFRNPLNSKKFSYLQNEVDLFVKDLLILSISTKEIEQMKQRKRKKSDFRNSLKPY